MKTNNELDANYSNILFIHDIIFISIKNVFTYNGLAPACRQAGLTRRLTCPA